jgi:hypothetical protein
MLMSDQKRLRLRGLPLVLRAFIALASVAALGCYHRTAINPTELPELSDSYATPISADRTLTAVSVAHVEKPDGTVVEIRGEFDVVVRLEAGSELEFTRPVRARLDPSETVLVISGSKEPEQRIGLDRIASVEVLQFNETAAWVAGSVVGAGIFVFVSVISR